MREEGGRAGQEKGGQVVGPFHFDRFLLHMIDTMCLSPLYCGFKIIASKPYSFGRVIWS